MVNSIILLFGFIYTYFDDATRLVFSHAHAKIRFEPLVVPVGADATNNNYEPLMWSETSRVTSSISCHDT